MQVFGVCQLSELKGWRRGSPDNQAATRQAAVGSGGIAGRRTPYHGPAAHIGCGATDRRSMAPSSAVMDHALRILRLLRTAPVRRLIQYSKSLQHLYNQYRPHGALAGQTPASYLKER